MDGVSAAGWQSTQRGDQLDVLVAQQRGLDPASLAANIRAALEAQEVQPPCVEVRTVAAIPRTALGKAPLILKEQ
jgi:hypothetical protein